MASVNGTISSSVCVWNIIEDLDGSYSGRECDQNEVFNLALRHASPGIISIIGSAGSGKGALAVATVHKILKHRKAKQHPQYAFILAAKGSSALQQLVAIGTSYLSLKLDPEGPFVSPDHINQNVIAACSALNECSSILVFTGVNSKSPILNLLKYLDQCCIIITGPSQVGCENAVYPVRELTESEARSLFSATVPELREVSRNLRKSALTKGAARVQRSLIVAKSRLPEPLNGDLRVAVFSCMSIPAQAIVIAFSGMHCNGVLESEWEQICINAEALANSESVKPVEDPDNSKISFEIDFSDALTSCREAGCISGHSRLLMHGLWRHFVSEYCEGATLNTTLYRHVRVLRRAIRDLFVSRAESICAGDQELRIALCSYPWDCYAWARFGTTFTGAERKSIAKAIGTIVGSLPSSDWYPFDPLKNDLGEALPQALELVSLEAQQLVGPLQGSRPHTSDKFPTTGSKWHEAGHHECRIGNFEAALCLFERAAREKFAALFWDGYDSEESVGASLHQAGYCLALLGRHEDALSRLAAALQMKDRSYGKISGPISRDFLSIGITYHQMGYCAASLGDYDSALDYYFEAIRCKSLGNRDGEIDHRSLAFTFIERAACFEWSSSAKGNDQIGDISLLATKCWLEAIHEFSMLETRWQSDELALALCWRRLGAILQNQGRLIEAAKNFRNSLICLSRSDCQTIGWKDEMNHLLNQIELVNELKLKFATQPDSYSLTASTKDKKPGRYKQNQRETLLSIPLSYVDTIYQQIQNSPHSYDAKISLRQGMDRLLDIFRFLETSGSKLEQLISVLPKDTADRIGTLGISSRV